MVILVIIIFTGKQLMVFMKFISILKNFLLGQKEKAVVKAVILVFQS